MSRRLSGFKPTGHLHLGSLLGAIRPTVAGQALPTSGPGSTDTVLKAVNDALVPAGPDDTVLTTTFSVMWPAAPHRVLRSCVEAAEAFTGDNVGEMALGEMRMPMPRFAVSCPDRQTTGTVDAMALYAGQSVGAVERVQPAGEIVRELAEGAEALMQGARQEHAL